ncbi:hypothetical protein ABC383_16960 [Noviherbaspirillum sp. 1P10PC]|uniref:hypothetical protein n=1 Tax=Noviherbaspirillum sp. 1P10PC TaxID=3132292 RepID=UPI0039A0F41C
MTGFSSFLLDREAAARAVAMVLPMISSAIDNKSAGESGFFYLIVMKPGSSPASSSFEEAILYEHAVGDRTRWDADYRSFALAKARVAWRTGMDSHLVQEQRPYLLEAGDTLLWGSVALDGIVVAASGADPWYDEAFAGAVALCLRAQAKATAARARSQGPFLPQG